MGQEKIENMDLSLNNFMKKLNAIFEDLELHDLMFSQSLHFIRDGDEELWYDPIGTSQANQFHGSEQDHISSLDHRLVYVPWVQEEHSRECSLSWHYRNKATSSSLNKPKTFLDSHEQTCAVVRFKQKKK